MRLAIPCVDGVVCQEFESCQNFRLYDIDNRIITSAHDAETSAVGVSEIADFLLSEEIDGIICGAIEEDSCEVLIEKGLAIYSGAEGDPDKAVDQLLFGDIITPEGEYDHTGEICMEGPNAGKFVRVHYEGTFDDGSVFDSSYERGEPLEYTCAIGLMIEGFDRAVVGMSVGDVINVHLEPKEAYGEYNPAAVVTYPIKQLPGLEMLQVGQQVSSSLMGVTTVMTVIARDDETITFDSNHDMAGKALNFKIELLDVR